MKQHDNDLPDRLGCLLPSFPVPEQHKSVMETFRRILREDIAPMAAENDRQGRYPRQSIAALKAAGFLRVPVPVARGGLGFSQALSQHLMFELGRADPAVAQIYKVHDDLTRELLDVGSERFCAALVKAICEDRAIIGAAIAENGRSVDQFGRVTAAPDGEGGYVLNGRKIYATGAAGADLILVASFDLGQQAMRLDLVPAGTPGMMIGQDWDRLGQRATDSGSVTFENLRTCADWSALAPGRMPPVHGSLRYQNGFSMILLGIGADALNAATDFVVTTSRPWPSAQVERAGDDLLVRRLFGEIGAELAAACALGRNAAELLDAFERAEVSRTDVAMSVYAARSSATRSALRATSDLMSVLGARVTDARVGFDRYWRDARTLSLHDPVEWKHEEIGQHLLTGWEPPPGLYQ